MRDFQSLVVGSIPTIRSKIAYNTHVGAILVSTITFLGFSVLKALIKLNGSSILSVGV
jgi:hypothetical protein